MVWPDDEYLDAMRAGIKLANSRGVTAVHDKDGWLGALRLWRQIEERGSLSLRVWQSIPHERVDEARALGVRSGFGSPYLRLGYLKVFMDGTLGSQTAWMLDGSGVQITSGDELADIVRGGAEAGFPVAVHAIGDRANREALDAFAETRAVWQPKGLRQRIEHAQLLAPEDLHRFAELGVTCSVQFSHAPSDRDLADEYWAGKTRRRLRVSGAARVGRRALQRQRRPDRGARPTRRHPRRGAALDRQPPARGIPSRRSPSVRRFTQPALRPLGSRATNAGAGR